MLKHLLKSNILPAFALCFLYWTYLFFTAEMQIIFDAVGYEDLGKMIYKEGWVKYFETGPNREPLYPCLVAFSMFISDIFHTSYIPVQKIMQIIILFVTQILTLKILRTLKVKTSFQALSIIMLGFSPALINSTFSLFSEIITYPLVLAIVLISPKIWQSIHNDSTASVIRNSLLFAFLYILLISSKAIFEYQILVFLCPFYILLLVSLFKKNYVIFKKGIIFLFITLGLINSFTYSIKSLNQKYNNNFAFTDRGAWILYAKTVKRVEPMTSKRLKAFLTSIPGEGVCNRFADPEECEYQSSFADSGIGHLKSLELYDQGYRREDMNGIMFSLSKELILKNPFKYTTLTFLESFKILFWESTQIGGVKYPSWLSQLFSNTLIKNGIRLLTFCLSLLGFFYVLKVSFQNLKTHFTLNENKQSELLLLAFLIIFIITFTALYSLSTIIPRYSFPIASLFVITTAYSLDKLFTSRIKT